MPHVWGLKALMRGLWLYNTSMTGIPNGGTYLKSSSTEFSVNDAITKCTQLGGTGNAGSVGSALTFIF